MEIVNFTKFLYFFVSFVLFVVNPLRPPVLLRNRHPSRTNQNEKTLPTRNYEEPQIETWPLIWSSKESEVVLGTRLHDLKAILEVVGAIDEQRFLVIPGE